MGNKQKNIKNNNQKGDSIKYYYLLCPKCWKKVPYLNTFIDGDNIKIKIICTCLEDSIILDLVEYMRLISNRDISNQCIYHPDTTANKFCINCENWLCQLCYSNHTKEICKTEYNNSINEEKVICFKHKINNKKIYFCKKCRDIFCKACFMNHNLRNKSEHKGINIENYLTKEKIKSKSNKYQKYQEEVIESNNACKNDILIQINSLQKNNKIKNTEELLGYKNMLQDKYLSHKNVNEQLRNLIEILLKNYEYFNNEQILNRKYICNVIMNTSINTKSPKLNKELSIMEQVNYFINFLNENYINKRLNSKLSFNNTIYESPCTIEMMLSLPGNKFVSTNKDCAVQIWDTITKKNIYTMHEHTNNITSIILLRNKKYFATASDDSTIKIWDYSKGNCIKTIITEGKPFLIYEVYGKENQIGCFPYRNSLVIYEYNEANQNKIINISLEKSIPWIEGLYQFPNDGRIILSSSGFFEVHSLEIKAIKKIYISNDIPKIFLLLKNGDLAVGLLSKEVFIYNNDFMYKTRLLGHKKSITSILELDENKLLTSSLDSNIILWGTNDYEIINSFINNKYGISSMILINKNRIITSSSNKNSSIDDWEILIFNEHE